MADLLSVLYEVIAPIFLIVGVVWALDRRVDLDPRPLSRLLIYVFSPCLVLDGITHADLDGREAMSLAGAALLLSGLLALVGWLVARLWHFDQRLESAFLLSIVLINAGNYGLPLNRLAFGAKGESRAMVYFVATYVVSNTFGVFIAARGSRSTWAAIRTVFLIPLPYAAALGILLSATHRSLPGPLDSAVALLAPASIPGMLAVLGIRLSRARLGDRLRPLLVAAGLRLLLAPIIAVALAAVLGLTGTARQVSIVQAAMPTAIISSVLAIEFGADSDFVTGVILITTLSSVVTLSVLLLLVGWHG